MTQEKTPDNSERPSRDAYLGEQSRWYDSHPEQIVPEVLNNFYMWMPSSKYIEQFSAYPHVLGKVRPLDPEQLHSLKRATQTTREFIRAISDAVDTIPGLRERIEEMQKRGAQPQEQHSELIELYKALRRQGYSHYDLVA